MRPARLRTGPRRPRRRRRYWGRRKRVGGSPGICPPRTKARAAMHAAVLRYFDQVARLGSIRRAAESLNVASSAVNRQIIKLEEETGTALFERLRTGVRLTAAG